MRLMLKHKIIGLALIAALLPVVVMTIITQVEKNKISKLVIEELDDLARENIAQIARDMHALCNTVHEEIQSQVDINLNVARKVLEENGGISFSTDRVDWRAFNQYSKETIEYSLPRMNIGRLWPGKNRDLSVPTPVIDEVVSLVGGACAIFQRMNEEGDMLCVATNVESIEGSRAIGTFMPAIQPDGTPDPVVSAVLQGEAYRGRAFVVNAWHITSFEPLKDDRGNVIGILYVGIRQESEESLRQAIMNTKVGRSGYVYILGGKGEQRGHYIVSKDGVRDGEDIWESQDENGRYFIQSIINKALVLQKGEVDFEVYPWRNKGELMARNKIATVMYFEPWDWVIGAGTYEDDYYAIKNQTEDALEQLLALSGTGGLLILLCAVFLALFLGRKIVQPITEIITVAQQIAQGDLNAAKQSVDELDYAGKAADKVFDQETVSFAEQYLLDETGQLLCAIRTMTQNLNSLVGQVQESGIQVTTSTTQIAASARQQEAAVTEQAASANEVVSTCQEIVQTSQGLVKTMNEVNEVALETASLADNGRSELAEMETTVKQLSEATSSIVSKLSIVREKANNIDNVITTINKVADQTNLLSLNAAIEAEKAGEYGLGFSVVAREIRRLADQTAVSTLDIEHMVNEMQSAVSAGVMEMDKFTDEVRQAVDNIGRLGQQLERIIEQVQALIPRFEEVNEGMQSQSQGARQISEAMVQLNEIIQQTKESLGEFNNATEQLSEASRGLQEEVSRFKVS